MVAKKKTVAASGAVNAGIELAAQLDLDQKRYSRYVCDSRAIPNVIDGLKPVQRRVLWTIWNSSAREAFTKTVKVAGMVMAYHPHGNASIEDAIAQMTQSFPFTNNYSLITGEGTFGDILDPKAIASPRYTEVKLSAFARDVGLFESLPDIDYISNYDETTEEPIYFVPKLPLVLLNSVLGIATGFKCYIPPRRLEVVGEEVLRALYRKTRKFHTTIDPWMRNYAGRAQCLSLEGGGRVLVTGFGFAQEGNKTFLVATPHNWNRGKTIHYLEQLIKEHEKAADGTLKDYEDYSRERFRIELIFKRGVRVTPALLDKLFTKETRDIIDQNVITSQGRLQNRTDGEIIEEFLDVRQAHLIRRFTRLERLEREKLAKESELIRFIAEKWHEKVIKLADREALRLQLQRAQFVYGEWLTNLPIYRLTKREVKRAEEAMRQAKIAAATYQRLKEHKRARNQFIAAEIRVLMEKWKYVPSN